MAKLEDLTVRISLDTSAFEASMKQLEKSLMDSEPQAVMVLAVSPDEALDINMAAALEGVMPGTFVKDNVIADARQVIRRNDQDRNGVEDRIKNEAFRAGSRQGDREGYVAAMLDLKRNGHEEAANLLTARLEAADRANAREYNAASPHAATPDRAEAPVEKFPPDRRTAYPEGRRQREGDRRG